MATEAKHPTEEHTVVYEDQRKADSRAVLALEGMTCASCAMRIEKGLKKVPGVKDANVNLATEQAAVVYDPTQTNLEQMVQKVEAVGYKATPEVTSLQQPAQEIAIGAIPETTGTPILSITQEDELSRRRQAEVIRKRKAEQEINAQLAALEADLMRERHEGGTRLTHSGMERESWEPETQAIPAD